MTTITDRSYRGEDDFWTVRDFLDRLFPLVPPRWSWDVRRWDGSNCHTTERGLPPERAERTRIWEEPGHGIVAAALHEGGPELHPQVLPSHRDLTDRVVAWGEETAARLGDARVDLHVWDADLVLRRIAEERGYAAGTGWGIARVARPGRWEIPAPRVPGGYRMRATRLGNADDEAIAVLLNAAFGRTFHRAEDHRAFAAQAPSFRRDLDLVAVAPDGALAAYAALCWDGANCHAVFEPVCTHPEHRRRGLAKALMLEGMHRARRLGAVTIGVETGDLDPANALYASLPFGEVHRGMIWSKDL